jgi:hypothetical protein
MNAAWIASAARKRHVGRVLLMNGDMIQILSSGSPTYVRLYNTPLTHREDVNPDVGIRFDHMAMNIPAQAARMAPGFRCDPSPPRTASSTGTPGRRALASPGRVRRFEDRDQGRHRQVRRAGGIFARSERESELHRV